MAMESIKPPFNPELMEILNQFITDIYKEDLSKIKYHDIEDAERKWGHPLTPDEGYYYTSDEHLDFMRNQKTYKDPIDNGFAEVTRGINLSAPGSRVPERIKHIMTKLDRTLNAYFCTMFTAVNMYYPKQGYMGWHNNNNCPGWNVIMSYTPEPHQGFFMYVDPATGEKIKLEDTDNMMNGWTIKVGYYGSTEEVDRHVWHCARSYDNERITLAYVIPDEHKEFWDLMVEDIKSA